MAYIEAEPCVDEVLRWLTPACSLALRTTNHRMNRAWWKHVLQWLEHEMGSAGWLATEYFAWWKQASSSNAFSAFAGPLRSRKHFNLLHQAFVEAVRARLAQTLHPHLEHVAPLLQAPSVPAIRCGLGAHKKGTLVQQYRAQLQRLEWRELWEKAWETLCWMPAMWSSVSYAPCHEDAARVLDERIMALKVPPSRFPGYFLETAWDALCARVLPLESQFYSRSMPRAPPEMPSAPHCPNLRMDRVKFRKGAHAFLRDHQLEPSPRLLHMYHFVCTRMPRHRTGSLMLHNDMRLHLERGRALDCLQMFDDNDNPVATLVVRRSQATAAKFGPIVHRARLLCISPRKMSMFEKMTPSYFQLCGKKRKECIWCGRHEPRGACLDLSTCRTFAA